jgi:hypothetical protein
VLTWFKLMVVVLKISNRSPMSRAIGLTWWKHRKCLDHHHVPTCRREG